MCILWIEEVKDAQRDEKPKRRGRKGERNRFKRVEGPCGVPCTLSGPHTL